MESPPPASAASTLDARIGLVSPEGVQLELPIAGPALRIFAYGIDYVLVGLLALVIMVAAAILALAVFGGLGQVITDWGSELEQIAETGSQSDILLLLLPMFLIFFVAAYFGEVIYFVFFDLVSGGRSPGKWMAGIRVVRRGGRPIDLRSSLLRNLLRIVDSLPSGYLVGLIAVVVSGQHQRLGDRAADTIVIRADTPQTAAAIPLENVDPLPLTRTQLSRVGDRELALIRGTLRRAQDATERGRAEQLLDQAARSLASKLELDMDEAVQDPQRLLERLLVALEQHLAR